MKSKCLLIVAFSISAFAQRAPRTQERLPREVTVTPIPGVIADRVNWQEVWQGTNNADGIVGTSDGGLLFAQEQPSTIRKLDKNDNDALYISGTHGAGAVAIDAMGHVLAVQRTCTDPGRGNAPCSEPTAVAIIYPPKEQKILADNFEGKPLGRLNDLVVDKKGRRLFHGWSCILFQTRWESDEPGREYPFERHHAEPDEKTLYVTNGGSILAFDILPDGTVTNRRDFARLQAGNGDGMAVDDAGRLYVTSAPGVQVFDRSGKYLGTIPSPRSVISVAFSGPGKRVMYVVGSGASGPDGQEFTTPEGVRNNAKTIYKIQMLARGYKGRAK